MLLRQYCSHSYLCIHWKLSLTALLPSRLLDSTYICHVLFASLVCLFSQKLNIQKSECRVRAPFSGFSYGGPHACFTVKEWNYATDLALCSSATEQQPHPMFLQRDFQEGGTAKGPLILDELISLNHRGICHMLTRITRFATLCRDTHLIIEAGMQGWGCFSNIRFLINTNNTESQSAANVTY